MTTLIPLDKILPNPEQPRQEFDEAALLELSDSILENGVIIPIVVEEANDMFVLHDGERRWRASHLAGLNEIPAQIVPPLNGTAAHDRLLRALVANIQRADLTPIEEARAYARLRNEHGLTVKQVAWQCGVKTSRVDNRLLLLDLPQPVQDLVSSGKLHADPRVARAVRSLSDEQDQIKFAQRAADGKYSINAILGAAARVVESARVRKAASADDRYNEPALTVAAGKSGQPLSLPAWDALAQVGVVPPWQIVAFAARQVCGNCSLRSMASPSTCGECPSPAVIASMMNEVNKRAGRQNERP